MLDLQVLFNLLHDLNPCLGQYLWEIRALSRVDLYINLSMFCYLLWATYLPSWLHEPEIRTSKVLIQVIWNKQVLSGEQFSGIHTLLFLLDEYCYMFSIDAICFPWKIFILNSADNTKLTLPKKLKLLKQLEDLCSHRYTTMKRHPKALKDNWNL